MVHYIVALQTNYSPATDGFPSRPFSCCLKSFFSDLAGPPMAHSLRDKEERERFTARSRSSLFTDFPEGSKASKKPLLLWSKALDRIVLPRWLRFAANFAAFVLFVAPLMRLPTDS